MIAGLSRRVENHTIKTGFEVQRLSLDESFAFAVTDPEVAEEAGFSEAALAYTVDQPFAFAGSANPMSWSVFLQDEWTVRSGLTVSGGVRFDSSGLGQRRQQLSPRVGAAYRADRHGAARIGQPIFSAAAAREFPAVVLGRSAGALAVCGGRRRWRRRARTRTAVDVRGRRESPVRFADWSRRRGVAPHDHRRRRSQRLRRHDDHLSECRRQGPRRRRRSSRRAAATIGRGRGI